MEYKPQKKNGSHQQP